MAGSVNSGDRAAWSSLSTLLRTEQLLSHNAVVGIGTIAAGVLGVAFQSLVSHHLRPSDYGSVFAVVTAITLIGLPASAFTLLMARETSRARAIGHEGTSATLLRRGNRALLLLGVAVGSAVALDAPTLSRAFTVPADLWIAAAIGLPFALALPLLLGELQGEQRFLELAAVLSGQAGLKLLGAVVLGALFGPVGVILGISGATLLIYLTTLRLLRRKFAIKGKVEWLRPAASYLVIIIPSTIALAVFLSADALMVKHYFPPGPAGQYAVVAAIGRAVFWGASGVAAVMFPKLTFRNARGNSGIHLVGASLVLVGVGGAVGFVALSVVSSWLLTVFAGNAYVAAAGYLPWYSVAMTFLGAVSVLVATQQTRGRPGFLAVLLPATALEPLLIVVFHHTLSQVVLALTASTLVALAGLSALYLFQQKRSTFASHDTSAEVVPVAQWQGNS